MSEDGPKGSWGISIATPMEEWTPEQMAVFSEALQIIMEDKFNRPRQPDPFDQWDEEPDDSGS